MNKDFYSVFEYCHTCAILTNINGIIEYTNKKSIDTFGYQPSELIGQDLSILIPDNLKEKHHDYINHDKYAKSQIHVIDKDHILTAVHKTNGEFKIDINVHVIEIEGLIKYLVLCNHDRSLFKIKNTEKLDKTVLLLNQTESLGNCGTWEINISTNSISMSKEMRRIYCIDDSVVNFDDSIEYVHSDDIDKVNSVILNSFANKHDFEIINRLRDKTLTNPPKTRYVHSKGHFKDGVFFGTTMDITERRFVEDELNKNKIIAENKTAFLACMSHDLRTPLSGILGICTLLEESGLGKIQKEYVFMMNDCITILMKMINEILDRSKIDSGKMQVDYKSINLKDILNKTNSLFKPKAIQKGINFDINIDSNVPVTIRSDHYKLEQIINNLTSNAVKFTESGSININVYKEADTLIIKVSDTGIGMNDNQQKLLFQPFVQVDPSITYRFGGTGLGLSICKDLVELIGGSISVDSELDKGSIFKVILTRF